MLRRPFKGMKETPTCSESRKTRTAVRDGNGWGKGDFYDYPIPKSTLGNGRHIESFPYMSMNAKRSDPEDIARLRDYLRERYTVDSFISGVYDSGCSQPMGLRYAVFNTLQAICRSQGFSVSDKDLDRLTDALIDRADYTF